MSMAVLYPMPLQEGATIDSPVGFCVTLRQPVNGDIRFFLILLSCWGNQMAVLVDCDVA